MVRARWTSASAMSNGSYVDGRRVNADSPIGIGFEASRTWPEASDHDRKLSGSMPNRLIQR